MATKKEQKQNAIYQAIRRFKAAGHMDWDDPADVVIEYLALEDDEPRQKAKIALDLMAYCHPKLKQVEAKVEVHVDEIERLMNAVSGKTLGPPSKRD